MKYEGYHPDHTLPVKPGDVVTIVKGTPVWHQGEVKPAGKTYKVTVHHILPGCNHPDVDPYHRNPKVVWPGSGGYWSEADINYLPEINAEPK